MKNFIALFIAIIFFTNPAFGQGIPSKQVQSRLSPIVKAVEVNEQEKASLAVAIEEFQEKAIQLRKNNSPAAAKERKSNNRRYLKNIKKILGAERYQKWRKEVKRSNKAKTAPSQKTISNQVKHRLNPIMKAVKVNEQEKAKLAVVIEDFQEEAVQLRKENSPTAAKKLKSNNRRYLKNIKKILGAERYQKWRKEVKKSNNSK